MIPESPPATSLYEAARRDAVTVDRSDRARVVVSGADRRSYLNGLLTNDIAALAPGQGCYAAYLTAQGRMIADLWVYELGDVILLVMPRAVKDTLLAKLDQFVFTEDVQLADATESFDSIAVIGPRAADAAAGVLEGVEVSALSSLPVHGAVRARFRGDPVIVAHVVDAGVPGFDVIVDRSHKPDLDAALATSGVSSLDADTAEVLRIEGGVPKWHRDMDEDTIPLEAGIEGQAISFTKGCYVGQEVIIRVLHRGHGRVAKKLIGLTFQDASVPAPGSVISTAGPDAKAIGRLTSTAMSPRLGRAIALGYVHRDFIEAGTAVAVDGAGARVTTLPFVGQ
jgi:tRNA-modifying protein YgfZ